MNGAGWLAAIVIAASLTLSPTAGAQVNNPAYADYFLVGRFGEICTMCEAVVLCEAGAETQRTEIPASGDFHVYHLQTRSFWSQVSTIWEWFIANFSDTAISGHSRPAHYYAIENGRWAPMEVIEARVMLDPAAIVLDQMSIDRTTRYWYQAPEREPQGYCHLLPLWDSLETIEQRQVNDANG